MEEIQNQNQKSDDELLYSEKDFEEFRANLNKEFLEKEAKMKAELEEEAKKSSMTELELAQAELEEVKKKCKAMEEECLSAKQKEETTELLKEAGLDIEALEIVYSPLDMDLTKEKIEKLKTFVENIKKQIHSDFMDTTPPSASKNEYNDPFIEGFDTNTL